MIIVCKSVKNIQDEWGFPWAGTLVIVFVLNGPQLLSKSYFLSQVWNKGEKVRFNTIRLCKNRSKLRVLLPCTTPPHILVLRILKQSALYSQKLTVDFNLLVLDPKTIVTYVYRFRIKGIPLTSGSYNSGFING